MFRFIFKQQSPKVHYVPTLLASIDTRISAPAQVISPSLHQTPSSASSWVANNSSIEPSNHTCPASASFTSSKTDPTPLSKICPGFSVSYMASNPNKRDKQEPGLPMTPAILTQMHHILLRDPSNFDNIMLWSASL